MRADQASSNSAAVNDSFERLLDNGQRVADVWPRRDDGQLCILDRTAKQCALPGFEGIVA